MIGRGTRGAATTGSSIMVRPGAGDCSSNCGLIRPGQPSAHYFHKGTISLKAKLTGLRLKRRLMCDEGQLVLNKGAERFGNEVELPAKLLVSPTQPVEPDAKPFVEFAGTASLQPCTKSVGEDCSLR